MINARLPHGADLCFLSDMITGLDKLVISFTEVLLFQHTHTHTVRI